MLLILLVAGPEYFVSMELLALLDILGVALFLLVRPTLVDIRREPRLLALSVPIALFHFSLTMLGLLSVATGAELFSTFFT
jgi:hypothetical protein